MTLCKITVLLDDKGGTGITLQTGTPRPDEMKTSNHTLSLDPGLPDGDPGGREKLSGQEEPKLRALLETLPEEMKIREPPAGSGWRPGFYGPGNSPSVMQISSGVRSGSCNISSSAAFSR